MVAKRREETRQVKKKRNRAEVRRERKKRDIPSPVVWLY